MVYTSLFIYLHKNYIVRSRNYDLQQPKNEFFFFPCFITFLFVSILFKMVSVGRYFVCFFFIIFFFFSVVYIFITEKWHRRILKKNVALVKEEECQCSNDKLSTLWMSKRKLSVYNWVIKFICTCFLEDVKFELSKIILAFGYMFNWKHGWLTEIW